MKHDVENGMPRRPFDHHVEPLFAGLGLEDPPPRPARRRGALVANALLLLLAAAALLWWIV